MNTRLVLERATAALLFSLPAMAATDTWDGGGGNNLITLGDNWVDNTAPASDIANTDLIFAGLIRLTPALNASFSTRSITFNNTAGAFTISGQPLVLGTTGIVNNDTQTMTFDNTVRFSGVANSTINAAAGGLAFTGTVVLPTDTLAVTGGSPTSFTNFSGSSTLNIKDAGSMTWTPSLATSCDVTVNNSTLTMGADVGTDLFNSSATIAVNDTSTFNINESLTLDGAQLTRATGGDINLAAGKTLTIQNGGDAIITGGFVNSTASTISVTGAGSTFSTSSALTVPGGSSLNVAADGDVTSGSTVNIGTSGNGTVTVDGAGSTLMGTTLLLGANSATGSLAFTSNSAGTFTAINLVPSASVGTTGTLNIQSGADVTGTSLNLATIIGASTGTVTVAGTGSTLTIDGAGTAIIGALSGASGTLNVNSSGTFNSGTGQTTVGPTGLISVVGGDFNANGNFLVNGGDVTVDSAGDFNVTPGTTFTVQAGGVANMGDFFATNGSTFAVTGAGSTVSSIIGPGGGLFSVNNGSTATINNGARLQPGSGLGIANGSGNGSLTIDGAGTQLVAGGGVTVTFGGVGSLTFSNGSTGTMGQLSVDESSSNNGAVGTINVQSGATVTAGSLRISRQTGTHTGTLTIDGAGSALTVSGAGTTIIGAGGGSSGTLNVQNSGTHSTGTGLTTVNATGTIAISGGVYNSNGDLTLNGGQFTRDATGVFSLAAGRTFTVQNGGDAIFTGGFSNTTASTVAVTDAGSTFSTSSLLAVNGGSTLNVTADGDVTCGSTMSIGLSGNGTVTVAGVGSTLTINGAGSAVIGATSGTLGTLNVNSSGTFNSGTGLTTVSPTGTISVMGGDYNSTGNFTLDGGQVTVDSDGDFDVAPGTAFTVQAGGVANMGGFFATNGSTFSVTGAGSTVSSTVGPGGGLFSVNNGSTATFSNGARLQAQGGIGIANGTGNGSLTIDGAGTQLSAGSLTVTFGGVGSLTFSNGSTGTVGQLAVNESSSDSGAVGTVSIESGATVNVTGGGSALRIARLPGIHTGTLTIDGPGSALIMSGPGTATIGAASGGGGTLEVQNSGTFTSGTSLTTVHPTGTIAITGGTYTSNGDLTLNGGRLTRSGGTFTLAAGQALSVQDGGDAVFAGLYNTPNSATITVTGAGSTFSTNSTFNAGGGTAVNVLAGGSLSAGTANIGSFGGSATATIDGAGSSLTAATLAVGQNGFAGTLTFSNASTGTMGTINVDLSSFAGTAGILNIQSGATVTGTNLNLANGTLANNGTVLITGPGSALTLTGTATIGTASASTGTLTVESGGTFATGTGLTTVNATGDLNIKTGGTLTGAADFSGTGPVNIAGNFLPGTGSGVNQTTSVSFAQNMTFHPTTGITMEIGGTAPGTQHDQIVFNGVGSTQVKWDGTLKLVLINGFAPQAGQTFNLFDFDAARDTGAFTTIDVVTNGLMPPGLAFNFDELYTTGVVSVVSTGGITFAQWAATELGDPGASPLGDHNGNGYTNLIEYALGLFPAAPGTIEPNGGFHTYPDGEHLRVLFTRPLDRTGATLRVQGSSDLTTWNDLAVSVNSAPFTGAGFVSENRAHPLSEPGLVEVRDTATTSAAGRRYLRILITLAP